MTGTPDTPITTLVVALLAKGVSTDVLVTAVRALELQNISTQAVVASVADKRERERLKKARWRAKRGDKTGGPSTSESSSSNSGIQHKDSKKETPPVHHVHGTKDDWPEGYADMFWKDYPLFRRHDQKGVVAKLERLRRDGYLDHQKKRQRLTWAALWEGLQRYVASEPGEFAKGPVAWLNANSWLNQYHRKGGTNDANKGGRGGRDSFAEAAAGIFGGSARNGPAPAAGASVPPARRLDAVVPPRAHRGDDPPLEFDVGFKR